MQLEKLDRRDRRLILVCVVIALVSLFVGVRYYFLAFPEASIEFRVTRETSTPVAQTFLQRMKLDTSGYRHGAIFGFDEEQKTFLERELGVEDSNRLLETTVRLWRWQHRWFRPLQKEEMSVEVTTKGEVVEFHHALSEDAEGPDLPLADARGLAEGFLGGTMDRPLASLAFVESSTRKRPHRTDHSFTWKVAGSEVKNADYRIGVDVAGDAVVGYIEYLKVPDAWARSYQKLRSKNEVAGEIDTVLLLLTMLAMVVFLVLRIMRSDVRFRAAAILGGIMLVLVTVSQLNKLPSALYGYNTTTSFNGFLIGQLLWALAAGLGGGVLIFLLAASAEPFYRMRFPKMLSLTSLLRLRVLRTREFFIATLVGITLTFFFFAYENVFYLIANAMGAWAPREVAYSDLLSTAFPWVYVLFFGFMPAISEEFISRMFSIPFFEKALRSTTLAVVVSAFIWGFGHAGYPNQPFWIRGLEVGLAGIVFGLVLLRFGIASVVICHFSVDALYTAFVLIRSPNLYYRITGSLSAGIFLVLLLGAAVAYLRKGGFAPHETTNEAEGVAPEPAPAPVAVEATTSAAAAYRPLSAGRIGLGIALAAALFAASFVPLHEFGDWVRFRATRATALATARAFLDNAGFDVSTYRSALQLTDATDPTAATYLRDAGGERLAKRFYESLVPTPTWSVRFFVPGQKEEYDVYVDAATGSVVEFERVLAEDAPGASVPEEKALEIASAFLASRGVDPTSGELREQTQRDEKARRDHTLVWEFRQADASEARIRQQVVVQGDAVGSWTRFVKVPDEWRREREKDTALTVVLRFLKFPLIAAIAGFAIYLFVVKIRAREIPWKLALLGGGVAATFTLLRTLLALDTFWARYTTSIPSGAFVVAIVIGIFVATLGSFLGASTLTALSVALFPSARGMASKAGRRVFARDALVAAVVALGLARGMHVLSRLIETRIPAGIEIEGVAWPLGIETSFPFVVALANSVVATILVAGLGGILAGVISRHFKGTAVRVLLALAVVVSFLPAGARTMPEYVVGALTTALAVAGVVFLVRYFLRDNPLAWFFAAWILFAGRATVRFLAEPSGSYRASGLAMLVVVLGSCAWLAFSGKAERTPL